ncbi:MAG: hypothetical protein B6245_05430 [Desulfobacteraceae bacterium 4572_88]|nr:MAG: hypothetical protein B6245_05430 [Desulfobacteraceae bacterium 4572_88]
MCRTKNSAGGKPGFFFGQTAPESNKKKPGFFFCPAHSKKIQKDTKKCGNVLFIIFVCFVVKKADGLRTPCGKYTVGDSFLEIT